MLKSAKKYWYVYFLVVAISSIVASVKYKKTQEFVLASVYIDMPATILEESYLRAELVFDLDEFQRELTEIYGGGQLLRIRGSYEFVKLQVKNTSKSAAEKQLNLFFEKIIELQEKRISAFKAQTQSELNALEEKYKELKSINDVNISDKLSKINVETTLISKIEKLKQKRDVGLSKKISEITFSSSKEKKSVVKLFLLLSIAGTIFVTIILIVLSYLKDEEHS